MTKKCIHVEKIKTLLDRWEIKLEISNDDDYTFASYLGGLLSWESLVDQRLHFVMRSEYISTRDTRERNREWYKEKHNIDFDGLGESSILSRKDLEKLESHLKSVRREFLSIINECNCEGENNQQLVLRRNIENSLKNLISAGKEQLETKDRQITQLNSQLTRTQTEKDDYQNKWTLSETEVRRITELFNALQIENNRNKDKIKDLKGELGQSKESFLRQKIHSKEGKLETFIQQLGVNRGKIMDDLLNAYKRLLRAEKNFNQDNIDEADNSINDVKQQLLANGIIYRGISVDNTQKICSKCEKLAKLKLELNQIQQEQYQALQIQLTNN